MTSHRIDKATPIAELIPILNALPFLRVWQAAVLMGCSEATVYRLINDGQLPAVRWNRTLRIAREDLDAIRGTLKS